MVLAIGLKLGRLEFDMLSFVLGSEDFIFRQIKRIGRIRSDTPIMKEPEKKEFSSLHITSGMKGEDTRLRNISKVIYMLLRLMTL
jgi:hypothetical protein